MDIEEELIETQFKVKKYEIKYPISAYRFPEEARIHQVWLDDNYINMELIDGRKISIPLWWIPTLSNASKEELEKYAINRNRTMIIMKYMKKGFATMDSAVALSPEAPEVRLIRAINGTSVPKMFNRLKIALADFKYIEASEMKKLDGMTNKFWLPYYYYFGLALTKDEQFKEAEVKFAKVTAIDSDSEYAKSARQQLEKMKK